MPALTLKKPRADTPEEVAAPTAPTGLPIVNVLPPAILEAAKIKGAVRVAALAVLVLVVGTAVGYFAQTAQISSAQSHLDSANSQQTKLTAEETKLQPYADYYAAVTARQLVVTNELLGGVENSQVTAAMSDAVPAGVSMGPISITSGPKACSSQDPFHTLTVAGCVTFSGTAQNAAEVSTLIVNLENAPYIENPFVSSVVTSLSTGAPTGGGTTTGTGAPTGSQPTGGSTTSSGTTDSQPVSFAGTVNITPAPGTPAAAANATAPGSTTPTTTTTTGATK